MIPTNRIPSHPGEILDEEFLRPLEITQTALAARIRVPVQRVNELIRGKRGVTPDTALRLSKAFGTSPEFWTNLQVAHDIAAANAIAREEIALITSFVRRPGKKGKP